MNSQFFKINIYFKIKMMINDDIISEKIGVLERENKLMDLH